MNETYIVVLSTRKGQRHAARHPLVIPVEAARGRYDRLSNRALNDLVTDLQHEQLRRFTS